MRSVTILGATGSVGTSTLDLIEREPDRYRVRALTANCDVAKLAAAAKRTNAELAVVADERCLPDLRAALAGTETRVAGGRTAVIEAAALHADWTMGAIVGCAGLEPAMAAIANGGTVVLANKEPLVSAGEVVLAAAAKAGATLLPADSEHNAIYQCFDFERPERVRRIVLTASGGPFRQSTTEEMRRVTPEQAVAHPNWSMGAKISVDSATMMNKALEVIEARWLFNLAPEQIRVLIHPQSIIHSMVVCRDQSVLAQLGTPDMRVPIAYGLSFPERITSGASRLDLLTTPSLTFEEADAVRFPGLHLSWQALRGAEGSTTVLNAANEVAVDAFLNGRLRFDRIHAINSQCLADVQPGDCGSIEALLDLDARTRDHARRLV